LSLIKLSLYTCVMCTTLQKILLALLHAAVAHTVKLQQVVVLNPLTPNYPYRDRTAPLTSKRYILYIYSTNIGTEYFKHVIYFSFFSLQNAVCFIILTCLVPVLFTFYIQGVLKLKKNSVAKRLTNMPFSLRREANFHNCTKYQVK
jgi:hypothetical protein